MSESMNFPTVSEPGCEFTVTATSVPADGGTLTGAGAYSMSEEATLVATPALPTSVDVGVDMVWVADESGLGDVRRALMTSALPQIETLLLGMGVGSGTVVNRYGLVGHAAIAGGTHAVADSVAHTHAVLGDFATFITALDELANGGSGEDAYEALSYTAANMEWRQSSAVAKVIVFISDEDRNIHRYTSGGPTQEQQFEAIKAELTAAGIRVIGVLSLCLPQDGAGNAVMGFSLDPDKTWRHDGAGGYTNGTGGVLTDEGDGVFGGEVFPTGIRSEYGELVLDPEINGSFWDLDQWLIGLGVCDTNGTAVTVTAGYSVLDGGVVGGTITINEVDYEIANIADQYNLTLTTSAGVQTGVDWSVPNLGRDAFLAAFTDSVAESVTQLLLWTFDGWYDELGVRVSTDLSYTFRVDDNRALEARFVFGTG